MMRSGGSWLWIAAITLSTGCLQVLGLNDYRDGAGGGSASATATNAAATATAGTATGGSGPCTPGQSYPCYDGPSGTETNGICHAGTHVCDATGMGYGPCMDEQLPQAEVCSMKGDEDCNGLSCSETIWAQTVTDGSAHASAVAVDPDGNVYVGFSFSASFKIGATTLVPVGSSDIALAKFDPKGNPLWAKSFGTSHPDSALGLAADAGGVALLANAGAGGDTISFGGAPVDAGIIATRFDGSGAETWAVSCHAATILSGTTGAISIDPGGNVVIGASVDTSADCGGGSLPAVNFAANSLVAKFSSAGVYQWSKLFAPTAQSFGVALNALTTDSAGSVLFTGETNSTVKFGTAFGVPTLTPNGYDIFVVKLAPDGGYGFSAVYGDAAAQYGLGIAVDSTGDAIVVGDLRGTAVIGADTLTATGSDNQAFIAKFDPTGAPVWAKAFGDAGTDQVAQSVGVDMNGAFTVTGTFAGGIDFGGGALMATGTNGDEFLAKLSPAGDALWSRILAHDAGVMPLIIAPSSWPHLSVNPSGLVGVVGGYSGNPADFGLGSVPGPGSFVVAVAP